MIIIYVATWPPKKKRKFKNFLFWENIPYLWDDYWLRFTVGGSSAQMRAAENWSKVN